MSAPSPLRGALAEFVGTLLLAVAVIGSGIAAERLSDDPGIRLLVHGLATVAVLGAIIAALGPISGAYLNPLVAIADVALGLRSGRWLLATLPAQLVGAALGAILAHVMFGMPPVTIGDQARLTPGTFLGEIVATAGLLLLVVVLVRIGRTTALPLAVAGYIFAAIFFTSSAAFANPAITTARMLTDSYTGIDPLSALAYVGGEIVGAAIGVALAVAIAGRPVRLPAPPADR